MLLFNQITQMSRKTLAIIAILFLSACQFQPLHGDKAARQGGGLEQVGVASVDNRVAQQVRNHLLFLLNGGFAASEKTHEARLSVNFSNKLSAALPSVEDSTAGTVTVRARYDLIDLRTNETVASGSRDAIASYDRTGQVLANNRATRDAENRAAKEAAEALRLAIASDMSRL